jgi:cobalt/nickel transport system permease protein
MSTLTDDRDATRGRLPSWLASPECYRPVPDRDGFITRSMLSMTGLLSRLRLDAGRSGCLSPSAPLKLMLGLACILLASLAANFSFVLVMLAVVLVRVCLLPSEGMRRVASVSAGAAALAFVLMLPAVLLGQPRSVALVGTKTLVSTGLAMTVAVTTPAGELTGSLRSLHVPSVVVLTFDLALRGIYDLGRVAVEMLTALRLRSVGRNDGKAGSLGGVGGMLLLRANDSAQATFDAMRCRGFDGEYALPPGRTWRAVNVAWLAALALLVALFAYLQGLV